MVGLNKSGSASEGRARWPKARRSSGSAIAAEALMNNAGLSETGEGGPGGGTRGRARVRVESRFPELRTSPFPHFTRHGHVALAGLFSIPPRRHSVTS